MPSQVLANATVATDALPLFDSSGHLPPGIHSTTLGGLAGRVLFNRYRRRMWLQLSCFLIESVVMHKFGAAYIGGGFVSAKSEPSDIDLVLETASPYGPAAFESVAPFFVLGLDKIHLLYGVHLQFWMPGAPAGLTDYRAFFQYDRPDRFPRALSRARGIVRIDLADPAMPSRLRRYVRGENTAGIPITGGPAPRSIDDEIAGLHGIKRRLALMGANASRLVILTDARGCIEWVNESFVRACGYTLEEARGHKPGKLLQGPASSRETAQLMHRAITELHGCDCQIINYRKDGAPYAVRIILSPLFEGGEPAGFLAVEEDLGEPGTSAVNRQEAA